MNLSMLDNALWAACFAGNVALLFVLLRRRRWLQFPTFTTFITFGLAYTIVLFVMYRTGTPRAYAWSYWSGAVLDIVLQIAVIVEIARIVLRPTGTWVVDARMKFLGIGVAGALIAGVLAWGAHPSAHNTLDAWEIRGNLFTSMLTCELFTAVLIASQQFGLAWRNHVMRLGQGLTVWAMVSFGVDAAHSYFGATRHFTSLEHFRIIVYFAVQVWWIVSFWVAEPVRKPLSPDMRRYLVDLHERVQYDLARVVTADGKEPTHTP